MEKKGGPLMDRVTDTEIQLRREVAALTSERDDWHAAADLRDAEMETLREKHAREVAALREQLAHAATKCCDANERADAAEARAVEAERQRDQERANCESGHWFRRAQEDEARVAEARRLIERALSRATKTHPMLGPGHGYLALRTDVKGVLEVLASASSVVTPPAVPPLPRDCIHGLSSCEKCWWVSGYPGEVAEGGSRDKRLPNEWNGWAAVAVTPPAEPPGEGKP